MPIEICLILFYAFIVFFCLYLANSDDDFIDDFYDMLDEIAEEVDAPLGLITWIKLNPNIALFSSFMVAGAVIIGGSGILIRIVNSLIGA
jgi:hypothetical protein